MASATGSIPRSISTRIERLDPKGRAQQQLFPDEPTFCRSKKSPWAVEVDGFSVEADVHFGALDRKGREKLLPYFLRSPIATERFSILRHGSVAYRTRYGRGSKTHRIMQPMEAMARIAALVPPPRSPLLRYHGVLAPGSPLRSRVVPLRDRTHAHDKLCRHCEPLQVKPPARTKPSNTTTLPVSCSAPDANTTPPPVCSGAPDASPASAQAPAPKARPWRSGTSTIPWAELTRRTLDSDPAHCPRCEGRLEPIAIITRDDIVQRIPLNLPTAPEPMGPGGSFGWDLGDERMDDWVLGMDPEPPRRGRHAARSTVRRVRGPAGAGLLNEANRR
jgi:hypothetical protein